MSESKFIFLEPPKTALNKWEVETIIAHRRAFNIIQTAELNPIWKTAGELFELTEADLSQIYVLYEFIGDIYGHLSSLDCRIIGPLVILQSHMYSLDFPMRTVPTWAQSLCGKIFTGISFNVDDETEIRDKVIRLGGIYSGRISEKINIIIVGVFNPDDLWFQDAAGRGILILKKIWLDKVYESSTKFEQDSAKFFQINILTQNRIFASGSLDEPIDCSIRQTILEPSMDFTENITDNFAENITGENNFADNLFQNSMQQNDVQLSPIHPTSSAIILQPGILNDENAPPRNSYNPPLIADTLCSEIRLNFQESQDRQVICSNSRILQPNTSINNRSSMAIRSPVGFLFPNKQNMRLNLRQLGLNTTNFQNTQDSTFMDEERIDDRLNIAFMKNANIPADIQPKFGLLSNPDVQPKQTANDKIMVKNIDSQSLVPILPKRRVRHRRSRPSLEYLENISNSHSSASSSWQTNSIFSTKQSTKRSINHSIQPTLGSSSPEYVSQGPIMSTSISSASNNVQPVVWNDTTNERTSQMLRHNTDDRMSQYASENSTNPSTHDNEIFMDAEERELLANLFKN